MTQRKELEKDLRRLMEKYQIVISGCGCCGSPYIINIGSDYSNIGDIDSSIASLMKVLPSNISDVEEDTKYNFD